MRQSRRRSGWRATQPDPADVAPLLREAGFIGSKADPISCQASFDVAGRPRRVHARYADGWSCTLHLAADGSHTLSQCLRIRIVDKAPRP